MVPGSWRVPSVYHDTWHAQRQRLVGGEQGSVRRVVVARLCVTVPVCHVPSVASACAASTATPTGWSTTTSTRTTVGTYKAVGGRWWLPTGWSTPTSTRKTVDRRQAGASEAGERGADHRAQFRSEATTTSPLKPLLPHHEGSSLAFHPWAAALTMVVCGVRVSQGSFHLLDGDKIATICADFLNQQIER